jgi:hypothetical protein
VGFALIDRIIINIIQVTIKMKLDIMYAIRRKQEMEREVVSTMRIAGKMCNQRSKVGLID